MSVHPRADKPMGDGACWSACSRFTGARFTAGSLKASDDLQAVEAAECAVRPVSSVAPANFCPATRPAVPRARAVGKTASGPAVLSISVQPSTRTEKISLNGGDTTMGGSIIMPIDISIEGATRVMMRNGKNNGNPISKVRLSSEIMNAAITMRIDKSSGFRGVFSPDLSTNKRKSSSRTFFRNPRK
jgi:hypothetical protein